MTIALLVLNAITLLLLLFFFYAVKRAVHVLDTKLVKLTYMVGHFGQVQMDEDTFNVWSEVVSKKMEDWQKMVKKVSKWGFMDSFRYFSKNPDHLDY